MFELEGMAASEVGFIAMGSTWAILLTFKRWLTVEIRLHGTGKDYKFTSELLTTN